MEFIALDRGSSCARESIDHANELLSGDLGFAAFIRLWVVGTNFNFLTGVLGLGDLVKNRSGISPFFFADGGYSSSFLKYELH